MSRMPPAVLFAFGPHSSYFFYCNGIVIHENCSSAFRQTVPPRLARPYFVSLGPGEDEYTAFYETKDDKKWMSVNYPSTPILKGLEAWFGEHLKTNPDFATTANVVTTTDGKYMACTPHSCTTFEDAPPQLKEAFMGRLEIEKMETASAGHQLITFKRATSHIPLQMSVGMHGAWFIRWADGVCAWDLGSEKAGQAESRDGRPTYQRLRLLLGHDTSKTAPESLIKSIDSLVLDAWGAQNWFCVMSNGSRVECSLPDRIIRKIGPTINRYLRGEQNASTVMEAEEMGVVESAGNSPVFHEVPPAYQEVSDLSNSKMGDSFWKRVF